MTLLDEILPQLDRAPALRCALDALAADRDASLAVPQHVRPAVAAAVFARDPRPTLVVVAGEEAAERFARQLGTYLSHERVLRFGMRRSMPWDRDVADIETIGRRARAAHSLRTGRDVVVVASARALLRCLPPDGAQVFEPLVIERGSSLDLEATAVALAKMGYSRVTTVDSRGQFAVRGGTLDLFGSDAAGPVRLELFGDDVETVRRYVPSTQQTIGDLESIEIYPCREVRLGTRAADGALKALGTDALRDQQLAYDLERIEAGTYFDGIERYLPYFYKRTGILTEYLDQRALVVVDEPRAIFDDAVRYTELVQTQAKASYERTEGLFVGPAGLDLGQRRRLTLLSLRRAGSGVDAALEARRPETVGEKALVSSVRSLLGQGYRVFVTVRDRATTARLTDALTAASVPVEAGGAPGGVGAAPADGDAAAKAIAPARGVASIRTADIPAGFVIPSASLAVIGIDDIAPRSGPAARRAADPTRMTFSFKPGDYVVHAAHGIALFRDVVRREVLGMERDYLLLEYAHGDKLYVPVEQLDRVTKYVGPEGAAPRVTRLNTADWSRATGKARKAARKLAFDLVDLYARREAATGFAFGPDTEMQREMEAAFPFEETPDQLAAIAEVKADMESAEPMDRLVCGDVGYGKTEVAVRAVFKAVMDGKQVMVLCPTTILAQQHFTTFSDRYAPFPVRVEVLSRFRSKAEQAEALAGLAAGTVDVVIGTHRLLSADVAPKDLGLVVVDEEQRFGVEHKEHLKNLREQVDVLTLTATPIPRTLQMSLSGVRDMSVIDTPPPNRFPVRVHVGEYDPGLVARAISDEIGRGGQVYYIHNRVKTIDLAVERVRAAVPEARVAVGHGKMSEHQLERVMEGFVAGNYDVLVSTTIVESGIDNPHTNTLVIEDSERLGLAQLYQLKGRVGRSHDRAYAYFLFSRGASLTEDAVARLTAIGEFTDLGAGIKVAMRDLEIRGAGALLGAEQSGNVSAVGFDLYAEMLREAVAEARGEPPAAHVEISVNLPVPAFLPEEYVPDVDQRVRFYRRLAGATVPESVAAVADELTQQFGHPPEPARNLVTAARVRAAAAQLGISTVAVVRHRLTLAPLTASPQTVGRLAATFGAVYSEKDRKLMIPLEPGDPPPAAALRVLDAIIGHADQGNP